MFYNNVQGPSLSDT